MIGETLGHFRIVEKLGEGGMGVVYKARDEKLHRDVALKVLLDEVTSDPERRQRFLREARLAAAVTHPNIATIYEVGALGERIFIAMELVRGRSLRALIAEGGPLPAARATTIARAIASALARAHENQIVHRDLKPDNVMIDEEGNVKLLDFGIARDKRVEGSIELAKTEPRLTGENAIVGTVGYMAPEQAVGGDVDARADVFSLGVVLYEMLSGALPFEGNSGLEMLIASTRDPPKDLRGRVTDLPPHLESLVASCLEKKPGDRCPSARAFIAALDSPSPSSSKSPMANTVSADDLRPPRKPRLVLPVVLGIGLALALVWFGRAHLTGTTNDDAPVDAATDAPETVTLLELPKPPCDPKAVEPYQRGIAAMHDGTWSVAYREFADAVKADPACADAQFRFSLVESEFGSASTSRAAFQKASHAKQTMTPRSRDILDVYEPLLARDPPDFEEHITRAVALAKVRPRDAEVLSIAGVRISRRDPAGGADLSRRALALDPTYGDAWQAYARCLERKGDRAGQLAALDRCVEATTSTDCLYDRILIFKPRGACDRIEVDARSISARDPHNRAGPYFLAVSLAAQGKRTAALEANEQGWETFPAGRLWTRAVDNTRLAVRFGDFDRAAQLLARYETDLSAFDELPPHALHAMLVADLAFERGDEKKAARVLEDFVDKQSAWRRGVDDPLHSILLWYEPWVNGMRFRLGTLSRAQVDALDKTWRESKFAKRMEAPGLFAARALAVRNGDDVKTSLEGEPAAPDWWLGGNVAVGRALVLAGRTEEALPFLRRAVKPCDGFESPFDQTHAYALLGQALEATDVPGACAAYSVVLDRWSPSVSVTARASEAAKRRLKCP